MITNHSRQNLKAIFLGCAVSASASSSRGELYEAIVSFACRVAVLQIIDWLSSDRDV